MSTNTKKTGEQERNHVPACALIHEMSDQLLAGVTQRGECPLGAWLVREGLIRYRQMPLVWEIQRIHHQLHDSAREIVIKRGTDNHSDAITRMQIFQKKWSQFNDMLHRFRDEVEEINRGESRQIGR
ncbi:MAG: CZB domain-containing protein [Magnetococcales bacterium]|nr:CZB domain-containing protein [Magnetococcales bacterium]